VPTGDVASPKSLSSGYAFADSTGFDRFKTATFADVGYSDPRIF
jgi:hypothetical protein